MTDTQRQPQTLAIEVIDRRGLPVPGARIEILRNGALVGEMVSGGESSVRFEDIGSLEIRASMGKTAQSSPAPSYGGRLTLTLPVDRFVETAGVPTARCADGTTGQPCVTCSVDGQEIQICG